MATRFGGVQMTSGRRQVRAGRYCRRFRAGYTMAELVVVVVILGMFVGLAMISFGGVLGRNRIRMQAQELANVMQMAARAAAESDRRYEVLVDPVGNSYILRQITDGNLAEVLDEEIIIEAELRGDCQIEYIMFDDGEQTNQQRARFRAGRAGWAYGGKIVLWDGRENYSIVINRMNRTVRLEDGDVPLLEPKAPEQVPF